MEYIDAKKIVTNNKKNYWFGYEYNMNIYRGCTHGCIYCDSRCSCYNVNNFDEIKVKKDALRIVRDNLNSKVKKGVICTGSMSDPYNIHEEDLKLTRNSLELINAFQFGVSVITKSTLVTRDVEILKDIKKHSPTMVKVSITTPNDNLSRIIEPNVALSSERFATIKNLSDNGIFTGVLLMPVLPFITDDIKSISELVDMSAESGAKFIYTNIGVTLRGNQKEWYYNKLDEFYPGLKEKYIKTYSNRVYCNSKNSKQIIELITNKCEKYGILCDMNSIKHAFRQGYNYSQLSLF